MSTQPQASQTGEAQQSFSQILTEAVRGVQTGLTALQTAEGQETAAARAGHRGESVGVGSRKRPLARGKRQVGGQVGPAVGADRPERGRHRLPRRALEGSLKCSF